MKVACFSEPDLNTFAGDEMQSHLLSYFYSLTTDINPASQNLRVFSSPPGLNKSDALNVPGVRVHFFLLLVVCQSAFVSS